MRMRVLVALMLIAATGCAAKQTPEQKQAAAEKKAAQAEQKKAMQLAKEQQQANEKLEREQVQATASDMIRDERQVRQTDRFLEAQAASGARQDAMLVDAHFEGTELNSLGRAKLALIGRDVPAGSTQPVAVYITETDKDISAARTAAVLAYWKASPYAHLNLQLKGGSNDNLLSPAKDNMAGVQKLDKLKLQGATVSDSAGGSGTSGGGAGAGSSSGYPRP